MTRLGFRLNLIKLLSLKPTLASQTVESLAATQGRAVPRNAATNYLFGKADTGVDITAAKAGGPAGQLDLRVYRPSNANSEQLPLVFYIHGGGFILGDAEQCDWVCTRMAKATKAVVVSVEYRLAPRHPWPAAPEDCYAAFTDVVSRATEFGIDPARIAVVGESAGANLAAVVALMARDRSGPEIALQILVYPITDLTLKDFAPGEDMPRLVVGRNDVRAAVDFYIDDDSRSEPYASPLFADLVGLPAALVQVAERCPLRDDGARFAAALESAGVPTKFTEYKGMPHGYLTFPNLCVGAEPALAEAIASLTSALSTSVPRSTDHNPLPR